ncbi:hypothetical protein HK405_006560 [Cladochytrium tenue]|nr:hypothetical protein HK405_006560 [Cladochytrium tenue]
MTVWGVACRGLSTAAATGLRRRGKPPAARAPVPAQPLLGERILYESGSAVAPRLAMAVAGIQMVFWVSMADLTFRHYSVEDGVDPETGRTKHRLGGLATRAGLSLLCLGTGAAVAYGAHAYSARVVRSLVLLGGGGGGSSGERHAMAVVRTHAVVGRREWRVPAWQLAAAESAVAAAATDGAGGADTQVRAAGSATARARAGASGAAHHALVLRGPERHFLLLRAGRFHDARLFDDLFWDARR